MKIYFSLILIWFAFFETQAQNLHAAFVIKTGLTEFCDGDTVVFQNQSTGFTELKWIFGDNYETYLDNPKHVYSAGGNYKVILAVFDAIGNSDTAFVNLTVHDKPSLSVTPETTDTTIDFGQSIDFDAQGNFQTIQWSTGSTSSNFTVTVSGIYTITAVGDFGCKADKTITVTVNQNTQNQDVEITVLNNILTPNGDGSDDFLLFKDIDKFEFPLEITIYNNIGKIVFSDKNYRNNWSGNSLPVGTYYYIVKSKNRKTENGFIDLIP
jgi:gliding motility-associated-like protein